MLMQEKVDLAQCRESGKRDDKLRQAPLKGMHKGDTVAIRYLFPPNAAPTEKVGSPEQILSDNTLMKLPLRPPSNASRSHLRLHLKQKDLSFSPK